MTVILMSGLLIFIFITSKNAIKMQEFAEKQRLSDIRRKAAESRYAPGNSQEDVGAWVSELANAAGFDVSMLFEDEIPPALVKFLPMIKGFIEGGGLKKLMSGQNPDVSSGEVERAAI